MAFVPKSGDLWVIPSLTVGEKSPMRRIVNPVLLGARQPA
jgi:hypothetical protein